MTLRYSTLVRVLMVMSAISLVVAFGLALLVSPSLSLGAAVSRADHQLLVTLQDSLRQASLDWVWTAFVLPLIARPSWLLPLSLAVLSGGAAFSVATRPPATRPHRRRG